MASAVYMRISTLDQSTESQRADLNAWLDKNPQSDCLWYIDEGESRMTLARPQLRELRNAIADGKVDTVIVQRLDRLCGTLRDGLNLLHEWTEAGIRVVAVRQQIDLSGATGRLVAAVLLGVSEMEMEIRRERQRAGIDAAKQRGVYRGRKPGSTKASPRRAHNLRKKGFSMRAIGKILGVSQPCVKAYLTKYSFEEASNELP